MYTMNKFLRKLFWFTIGIDGFFYICFFVGFALGLVSNDIGFTMLSIAFKYGLILCIISLIVKFIIIGLCLYEQTDVKKKILKHTLTSIKILLIVGVLAGGIYYIGKVMSLVG